MKHAAELPASVVGLAPLLAVLLALAISAGVGSTLGGIRYGEGADEGHYLGYAGLIANHGLGVVPELFSAYVDDAERRFYPNPLRVGFFVTSGLWTALRGVRFEALSELSLLSHGLAILVVYGFARRLFGEPRALFVAALFGFSPLGLGLARRALMDSFTTLSVLLAIWAFWEAVRSPENVRRRLLFMLAFGFALLVKETGVLLLIPFAAVVAVENRRVALPLGTFGAALVAPLVLSGGVWLLAAGSIETLLRVVETILRSPASNVYASLVGGGPWYRYVIDFLLLSPWPTLLAMGACVRFALRARRGERDPEGFLLVALIAGLLLGFSFFTKNVRYVAVLEFPIRALAVCVLWELLRTRRGLGVAACGFAVLLLCALDVWSFWTIFVEGQLYDPTTLYLLSLRGIVLSP